MTKRTLSNKSRVSTGRKTLKNRRKKGRKKIALSH